MEKICLGLLMKFHYYEFLFNKQKEKDDLKNFEYLRLMERGMQSQFLREMM